MMLSIVVLDSPRFRLTVICVFRHFSAERRSYLQVVVVVFLAFSSAVASIFFLFLWIVM